jgi:uncharacterized protein (TIGR02996 family)
MINTLSFLAAIAAHPDDDAYRLIFADWLDENDDWRAEFVRLDCALRALPADQAKPIDLQSRWVELRSRLSPSWQTILGRSRIENCESRFIFQCPERWDRLAPTKVAGVRFCEACRDRVYYCRSIKEAKEHATQGHCVAVDEGLVRSPGDVTQIASAGEGELLGLIDFDEK